MSNPTPKTASLTLDGKTIDLNHADASKLSKDLHDEANFRKFAADPASFAKGYGLHIDGDVSSQLSRKLSGFTALNQVSIRDGGAPATVWAVAEGAYSIASTKLAVAF